MQIINFVMSDDVVNVHGDVIFLAKIVNQLCAGIFHSRCP